MRAPEAKSSGPVRLAPGSLQGAAAADPGRRARGPASVWDGAFSSRRMAREWVSRYRLSFYLNFGDKRLPPCAQITRRPFMVNATAIPAPVRWRPWCAHTSIFPEAAS